MIERLMEKTGEIEAIARRYRVARLAVFGSAVRGGFVSGQSDLDFLVEFEPMEVREYADHYFGLEEELGRLLGERIDLVERKPLKNPYLLKSVEESQRVLYEAA